VIFFRKGERAADNTEAVWIYDLRANMPPFGKTNPITTEHLAEFEGAYGHDPNGQGARVDQGERGRFRRFTRQEVAARNDNLDISWLRDDNGASEEALTDPDEIAAAIIGHLRAALAEIEATSEELAGEVVDADEISA
jgi:type I restriction enzyme M protein